MSVLPPLQEHLEDRGSLDAGVVGDRSVTTKTVAVLGLGYVGLPTALSLIRAGHRVVGVDINPSRLHDIASCNVDLLAGEKAQLHGLQGSPALALTTEPARMADADAVLICVPTPITPQQTPDLRALRSACAAAVDAARPGQVIVLTSTTYVGSTRELLVGPLEERGLIVGEDVFVAFSPERIDPGVSAHAPGKTPRVVGGITDRCMQRAVSVLGATCSVLHRVSSAETAEMTKLLENTFRAVNIAMINEFAEVAAELDVDVMEVVNAAATKPYGFMKFTPGPGVGGHCIPCDPHYLLWQLRGHRMQAPVIEASMMQIARRPRYVAGRVREELGKLGVPVGRARVHVLGVAYKPGVEDARESPAIPIIAQLAADGARVSYHDPYVRSLTLDDGTTLSTTGASVVPADIYLLHTKHRDVELTDLPVGSPVIDATYGGGPSWATRL